MFTHGGPVSGFLARIVVLLSFLGLLLAPAPHASSAATTTVPAYRLVTASGIVQGFGGAGGYGELSGSLNEPVVGEATTRGGGGFWMVASDGGVFSFGDAAFHGSTGGHTLNRPVVGMAADLATGGYWLVASDGGVFSFDAPFHGSTGAYHLNQPVVGMAATPDDGGYWLVASDGGIFSFGDARFYGSMGGRHLVQPVVGMAATPDGRGYWLVASDGGVFNFGDAVFYGSGAVTPPPLGVVGIAATPDGRGYWMADSAGLVLNFGDAGYFGSDPNGAPGPVVAIAQAPGTGVSHDPAYQNGSYGYDISDWQLGPGCTGSLPPPPHTIAIVEAAGAPFSENPCLATEAAWAGGGLNMYVFLANVQSDIPSCTSTSTCYQWGYNAAADAFTKAGAAGVNTSVAWWLDVEGPGVYWQASTALNDATIQGAHDALVHEGVTTVGIYASELNWTPIAGSAYNPPFPVWLAWYTGDPAGNCTSAYSYAATHGVSLPTGGIWLTQYSDTAGPNQNVDGDYAC